MNALRCEHIYVAGGSMQSAGLDGTPGGAAIVAHVSGYECFSVMQAPLQHMNTAAPVDVKTDDIRQVILDRQRGRHLLCG